jgi:hypothetical protein
VLVVPWPPIAVASRKRSPSLGRAIVAIVLAPSARWLGRLVAKLPVNPILHLPRWSGSPSDGWIVQSVGGVPTDVGGASGEVRVALRDQRRPWLIVPSQGFLCLGARTFCQHSCLLSDWSFIVDLQSCVAPVAPRPPNPGRGAFHVRGTLFELWRSARRTGERTSPVPLPSTGLDPRLIPEVVPWVFVCGARNQPPSFVLLWQPASRSSPICFPQRRCA